MDGSLRAAYREQFGIFSSLTQEEVEALYTSEGIYDKSISEIIKELEDEICALKIEQEEKIKRILETAYEQQENEHQKMTATIVALEEKRVELQRIQDEFQKLMAGINKPDEESLSFATIDKKIESIRNERRKICCDAQEMDYKDDKIYRVSKKLDSLEEKLLRMKTDYASIFNQLYSSSRGIMGHKRKFPSSGLRNEIVVGHLELARVLAAKYYIKCDKKIEFDDLHQMAYEALISAAHYYIPSPRAKFKTYATRCIENKLRRAIGETRKKKSKRPTKPLEFIDAELRRIDYVAMLIDACRNVRRKDGNKYFSNHFDIKPIWVQSNFKKSIRSYNSDLRKLGLDKEQLPSFKVKNSEAEFQKVLEIALSYLKNSQMRVIISSEDLEMASLVVSNENHNHDIHKIYELLYTIVLYQNRLKDVRILLEAEIELAKNLDGNVPSNEELLEEINRRIAVENKGIYKARNNSTRVSYDSLYNYRDIYFDLWGIDFLEEGEYANNRAREIKDLADDFESGRTETLLLYKNLMYEISDFLDDEIHLYKHCYDPDNHPFFIKTWDDEPYESIEEIILSKKQAIEFIKGHIAEIESLNKKDYVDMVLKWRKKVALAELNRLNAEVIETNRTKKATIRQQQATHYIRYWTIDDVQAASQWLNALYESGIFIGNSKTNEPLKQSQSVEDEVLDKIFMTDYARALKSLPPLTRSVMCYYYDTSGKHSLNAREIANILGITEKTVYSEKNKTLKLLRENELLKGYLE